MSRRCTITLTPDQVHLVARALDSAKWVCRRQETEDQADGQDEAAMRARTQARNYAELASIFYNHFDAWRFGRQVQP